MDRHDHEGRSSAIRMVLKLLIPMIQAGGNAAYLIPVGIMDPRGDEHARISPVLVEVGMLERRVVGDGVAPSPADAPKS